MPYEPLHHKYRPQTFADLVGQEAIATTLSNAIRTERIAPAYLFAGPRGTGKTSSARILAKSLNCLQSSCPTEQPCGVCEVCRAIAKGVALDVLEIDAASNTGVDNIRELIERAQFAPVQCRYKVYVIDECLTGDSLVQTSEGLIRIDDSNIQGKEVLSYNDYSGTWEFKEVVRWLDRGEHQTLVIKTGKREVRCTGNHLIRTEQGWIAAKDVKEGAKILSPVNADVEPLFTNLERMDASEDLLEATSSKEIPTGKNLTTWPLSWNGLKLFDPFAPVGVENDKSLPAGLQQWGIQQQYTFTEGLINAKFTTMSAWMRTPLENGWSTLNSIQYPQWITSLEVVESVKVDGLARVYDIEVEDNHNFVANGLLVHNCHMLSTPAFNALLKTLEEPPDYVVFVLATTDPQRVLPTIISRCQRFDFRRIALKAMVGHLQAIAAQENINIAEDAIQLLAQIAQGGLRDAESLLDQLSLLPNQITVERVWDLVGMVPEQDLMALLEAIVKNNPEAVLDQARHLMDRGHEPMTLLHNLAGFYRDLLIAKTASTRADLVTITPPTWTKLCEFTQGLDVSVILAGQQHLRFCEAQVKNTTQPRLWLEVTLLGLLPALDSCQPVGPDFKLAQAATSNQQSETSQAQPLALQPKQSASVTARLSPMAKPLSDPGTVATSTSTNGASQDQKAQPTQPKASGHTDRPETPPSSQVSEVPEPSFNQPALSQSSVEESYHNELQPATGEVAALPQADASPAADTAVQQPELDQIWRNVIDQLQPFSTQALLEQLCHLIVFDGQQARVGVRSQSWLKTVQEKLPNIEAAFQAVFEHNVKVKVEVAATTKPKTAFGSEQKPVAAYDPVSSVSSTHVTRSASNDSAAVSPSHTPSSTLQPRSQTGIAGPTSNPTVEITQPSPSTQPLHPATNTLPQTSNSPATDLHQTAKSETPTRKEDDEVTRNAKSLAQFFNGEVVSQENELIPGSIPPSDELYSSGQSLMDLTQDDSSEPSKEDEVPF